MVFCSGCRRNFKPSGYTLHIRRSHASACGAAHHEDIHAAVLNDDLLEDIEDVSNFQGDFFGNYEESDLPWPAEAKSDEDSEDDNHDTLNVDDYMDIEMDDCQGEQRNTETLGDCEGANTIFIEHFPSSGAGAAVSDYQIFSGTDYDCYQDQCGNTTAYAPFASRIDWDIARWAKVHKITSTAVTELLGINGVGFYATCCV